MAWLHTFETHHIWNRPLRTTAPPPTEPAVALRHPVNLGQVDWGLPLSWVLMGGITLYMLTRRRR